MIVTASHEWTRLKFIYQGRKVQLQSCIVPYPAMSTTTIPPLSDTIGALELGSMAAAVLYGVTSVQTYLYYRSNQDGKIMKGLIGILWVLDTLHFAVMTHSLYVYTVVDFGNYDALGVLQWSLLASVAIPALSDTIVRCIFTHRLWKLSGSNWILTALITTLSSVSFVLSVFLGIDGIHDHTFEQLAGNAWAKFAALGAGVGTDVLIAASLSVLLVIRRTGFSRTDSVVRRLILYSISTGAFTSLCEICALVFCGLWPTSLVWVSMFLILPELHMNALLASLNAREHLRDQLGNQAASTALAPPRWGNSIDPTSKNAGTNGEKMSALVFGPTETFSSTVASVHKPQTSLGSTYATGELAPFDLESNSDGYGRDTDIKQPRI